MKKTILAVAIICTGLFATDFAQMTTEELNAMRGSVPTEERDAFRAEMQSRMQAMTTEERNALIAERQANDQAMGKGLRDGSGSGQMKRGSGMGGKNR